MDETFDPMRLEGLLRRFDYASELKLRNEEHRSRMCETLLSFVEVRDSLERLLEVADAGGPRDTAQLGEWLGALRLIALQFDRVLEVNGVRHVACLGTPFEPGRHSIVEAAEAPGVAEGTIVREVIRGYEWDGEVLRKPSVIVARGE